MTTSPSNAVNQARERHGAAVRKAAQGNSRLPPDSSSLRSARIAEADAADALAAAEQALTELQNEVAPAEYHLDRANGRVTEAAKLVIADEVTAWPERMQKLHEDYIAQMNAFSSGW